MAEITSTRAGEGDPNCPHKRLNETSVRGSKMRADPVRPSYSVTTCLDCSKIWPPNVAPLPWWAREGKSDGR